MILSDDELRALTQRRQRAAQRRVLAALHIPYRERPDGTIVVFRRDVDGAGAAPPERPRTPALRLSALTR